MKSETILEVVNELIGYTGAYGDSGEDRIAYDNQEKLIYLVTSLVEELIDNSEYVNRSEYSMFKIGDRAYKSLEELYQMIEDAIK